jgi:hypothetical protein
MTFFFLNSIMDLCYQQHVTVWAGEETIRNHAPFFLLSSCWIRFGMAVAKASQQDTGHGRSHLLHLSASRHGAFTSPACFLLWQLASRQQGTSTVILYCIFSITFYFIINKFIFKLVSDK